MTAKIAPSFRWGEGVGRLELVQWLPVRVWNERRESAGAPGGSGGSGGGGASVGDAGVTVTVRRSKGPDVAAACGQLKGRTEDPRRKFRV